MNISIDILKDKLLKRYKKEYSVENIELRQSKRYLPVGFWHCKRPMIQFKVYVGNNWILYPHSELYACRICGETNATQHEAL